MKPPLPVRVPRSALPGHPWPALVPTAAAERLALEHQLEQSQWWTPAALREAQLRQLRHLLVHARRTSPFWRARLDACGLRGEAPPAMEDWRRLPPLTRQELQQAGRLLRSSHVPPAHGRVEETSSSGSTGTPVTITATAVVQLMWEAMTQRSHRWQGRDPAAKLAAIRHTAPGTALYPEGLRQQSWGRPMAITWSTGPSAVLSIATSIDRQAEWLLREDPDYLLTYPSNLLALLRHCAAAGMRPRRLREVGTFAEVLDPEVREVCREAWGVEVIDSYSAQETGYLALQCPQAAQYHVPSETVLLEVLDEAGAPCAPGECGRVVVTPLHNFATPLLRYAVGDHAQVGEPCACGRGLPVLSRILGRTRNTLVAPDGRRYWPQFGSRRLARIAPVRQHQFVQKDLHTIEARLVTERPLAAGEEEAVRELVRSRLPCPFEIAIRCVGEIPRSPSGKYEDFVSEVAD